MYAEFRQVSLLSVSNLEQGIEFDIVKRPAVELQEKRNNNQATANSPYKPDEERGAPPGENEEKNGGDCDDVTASKECEVTGSKEKRKKSCLGEFKATDYDEEEADHGFKTPTSLDHKIPAMTQCPPAPRKPKASFPSSNKRKTSPTTRRSLLLALSQEVESLFPSPLLADLHRKIKKARTEDNKR